MPDTRALLEQAITERRPALLAWLRRKTGDEQAAEDALQEACRLAFERADQLRDPARVDAWLRRIAHNCLREEFRRRRGARWTEAAETLAAAAAPEREELARQFLDVIARILPASRDSMHLTIIALRYVMDWDIGEIAAVTGRSVSNVNVILGRARQRLRKPPAKPPSLDRLIEVTLRCAAALANTALLPVRGETYRNTALLRESMQFVTFVASAFPDRPDALSCAITAAFKTAQQAEYADDGEPPRRVKDWRRERWDRALLARAMEWHRQFQGTKPPRVHALFVENYVLLYAPARTADIDLKAIERNFHEIAKLMPESRSYCYAAGIIGELDSPLRGARFLERYKNNPALRDLPRTWNTLGDMYFRAGYWAKAKAALNKFLRYPCNAATRRDVEAKIRACAEAMRARKKPTAACPP